MKTKNINEMSFSIIVVQTDGKISKSDIQHTINEIVNLSSLPIAIVIFGIGDDLKEDAYANLALNRLDGDDSLL